jgi:hypothetical protein
MKGIMLAATAVFSVVGAANAQEAIPHYHNGGGVYTSPINCDYLKGSKAACVVNLSEYDIQKMECEGMIFSGNAGLPGGTLAAGGIAIIEFKSGTCYKDIDITYSNGTKKSFQNVNIKDLTVWQIKGPRDPKHGGND